MVKKFLTVLFLFEFVIAANCFADSNVVYKDREHGYYIDGRGQVPEYSRIEPPNPDKIPQFPRATRTVAPFEGYYDVNELGIRREPNMTPHMPNHNAYYSERREHPYSKEEYVEVWCPGKKFENGIDCQSENYAITFVRASEWTFGVMKAPFKARKSGKQTAVFVMVDDLGLDAEAMHEVKKWGELFNMPIFFGTIDAYIPGDWII